MSRRRSSLGGKRSGTTRPTVKAVALAASVATIAAMALEPMAAADEKVDAASKPGMTNESLKHLPDFSGWWYLALDPAAGFKGYIENNPFKLPIGILKPEAAELYQRLVQVTQATVTNAVSLPDPATLGRKPDYCSPPVFSGSNGGTTDNFEFLFTPGRVTITSESGLLRRVYLDRALPADVDETNMGTSVGRWDGRTLVVETAGMNHDARLLRPFAGSLKLGKNARMVEHVRLKDPNTLEIELALTAPDVFTAPFRTTVLYQRDRAHVFHEMSDCVENDRAIDPVTGKQRFDLTPPEDLPPPPH